MSSANHLVFPFFFRTRVACDWFMLFSLQRMRENYDCAENMASYVGGSPGRGSSIWKSEFDLQFAGLPHSWNLREVLDLPSIEEDRIDGWKRYQRKGKVQFECEMCSNTWSSLNGVVIFHYRLTTYNSHGEVKMQLMRQKCKICSTENFEDAEWCSSEISEVLSNLLAKVKEKYYSDSGSHKPPSRQRREKMNGPHLSYLYEACNKGVCTESNVIEDGLGNLDLGFGL